MIKTAYLYVTKEKKNNWGVTLSESEAKLGTELYQIADMDDLECWLCATGIYYDFPVKIKEGITMWQEQSEDDMGYIMVASADLEISLDTTV